MPDRRLLRLNKTDKPARLTRRQLLLAGALLGFGGLVWETEHLVVTRHRLEVQGLHAPCRVVQLSDLHRSWCVPENFIARVVSCTQRLNPDVVLLSGDFVTSHSSYIASCARQLSRLHPPQGMYAVLGNHDYRCDQWQGAPAVQEGLQAVGIQMLTNRSQKLDCGLRLVGLDDCETGAPDPDAAFGRLTPGEPLLAFTHNPLLFDVLCGFPCVTLAGHTHGGQIYIPGVTPLFMDERARYLRGWFQKPQWPGRMYVSCGLGTIAIPARFNAPAEIALFELVPA
ncbi:predicted phosphohydrolase [Chthonomonas calidirosea]|uniref:metallophosphoesterase n=1 Tax=Chthonomonas calidirosea TaxID=454171 RepID=UPI0006DD3C02|nr:metallophosphoesterase [Chthonomonas calidirosea]CEK18227.1 predicted phosphohydrolase [Chthonomonas calidirosea]